MTKIGAVTVGRSDYSIYKPILRTIADDDDLELQLLVAGTHLVADFGMSVREIEHDGFDIAERIELKYSDDTPVAIDEVIAQGLVAFAEVFDRRHLDVLLIVGDRYEMFSAALAALPFKLAVAHIHGGEVTRGAIDDALRHCITKVSHVHFVSTEEYARRVIQLGENPTRVYVSGAPSLDDLDDTRIEASEIEERFGVTLTPAPLLVTFHPVTLQFLEADQQVKELLSAIEASALPAVFTGTNADTSGRVVRDRIDEYVRTHSNAWFVESFGVDEYRAMMRYAAAMVGNSSSGIVEAASFELPVVNVGLRQEGRVRAKNVLDVDEKSESILRGIRQALSDGFREGLRGLENPYKRGSAARLIVDVLKKLVVDDSLLVKRFYDVPVE